MLIDDFCGIRAAFHAKIPGVAHDIVITPKMSFGTGHHATTYLMIEAMRQIDFTGRKVLDFGTGTGILAILAEKCGATNVLAIDNDDWSVRNASENILINQSRNITVKKSDSTHPDGVFDIILANISKDVLVQNLPSFQQHLSKAGVLLMSGFLKQDEEDFEREAQKNNLRIIILAERQNWQCLRLENLYKR